MAEPDPFDKAAYLREPLEKLAADGGAMTDPKLNLNAVRVFAMAARHGNFQRAAEVLNLSHGAVSQRIKQLEGDLGVPLFERRARGVALTPAGETLFRAADEALSILSVAAADVAAPQGQITLHLGSSFATKWLMPRMADLKAFCPSTTFTTEVHDRVLNRALGRNEIAIWPGSASYRHSTHAVQRLCTLDIVAVCSPEFPRPEGPITVDTLFSCPLLQDAHRRWDRLMDLRDAPGPATILNFDRSALALDAAIHGHGVALVPTIMADADIRAGRLLILWRNPAPSGEDMFMSWSRGQRADRSLEPVRLWFCDQFGVDAVG